MTKEQLKNQIEATLNSPIMPPLTGDRLATLLKLMVDEIAVTSSSGGGGGTSSEGNIASTDGEWEALLQQPSSSIEILDPLEAKVDALGNNLSATAFLKGQFFINVGITTNTLIIGRLPEFAFPRNQQIFALEGHQSVELIIHVNGDVELKSSNTLPVKTAGASPYALNVFYRSIKPAIKAITSVNLISYK